MTALSAPRVSVAVRPAVEQAARTVAGTAAAGLLLGLVVGGVGSRLAMRALFLTSDATVRGVTSDDGFTIGRFTLEGTVSLLLFGTLVGVVGAFVYLAVRPFLIGPRWLRITTCGAGAGAVVGSLLVHVRGVDFTLLGPRWFAIGLFVALPALFGALAPVVVDKATGEDGWFRNAPLKRALIPLVIFVMPQLFVLIIVPTGLVVAGRVLRDRSPGFAALSTGPVTMWGVRAVWLAIAVVGAVGLFRDAVAIL